MKNWQTTLAGIIGGLGIAANAGFTRESIIQAATVIVLGFVAKDRNVTGGTRSQ